MRTSDFINRIKLAKENSELGGEDSELFNEAAFLGFLTENERSYFWNPTPEEVKEWEKEWFSTPVTIRLSSEMLMPPWHFGSMLDAFANGEYELLGIQEESGKFYFSFNPLGYPYGGTGCMIASLECFGHQVIGIDDGTGYVEYVPKRFFWKPKKQ